MGRNSGFMNSYEMAEDYLKRAERCLREAESAFAENDYPMAVRRSQECIELSVKGILRAATIEFPKEHDVSEVLTNTDWLAMGFPNWFIDKVERMAKIMREITPKRGPAMYGFEKEMRPPSSVFSQEDGQKATNEARFIFETCAKFFREWKA
jgi:HEPN domain-containing protein